MTVQPLGDKILLRIVEQEEEQVRGGIVVKGGDRRGYREAIVQAVGPRYRGEVKPGQTVYHVPFTGIERIVNGERFVFVKEFELLGIME